MQRAKVRISSNTHRKKLTNSWYLLNDMISTEDYCIAKISWKIQQKRSHIHAKSIGE